MIIRTGFSFKTAFGTLEDCISRVKELGGNTVAVCDRASTFSFNRLTLKATEMGTRPVYGVELGVSPDLEQKLPVADFWRFLAIKDLRNLHDLIYEATSNPYYEPYLLYNQALSAEGLIKISGSRLLLDHVDSELDFYVALSPSTPRGLYNAAKAKGHKFIAVPDNVYPRREDKDPYLVVLGRRSQAQSYPQWILSDEELRKACWFASDEDFADAVQNRDRVLELCQATMKKATIIKPDRPKSLLEMCRDGAAAKGVDLSNSVYAERLDRELKLIDEKNFADYFYVVADLLQWAKERMICGPGRGSSSGSLVCYLLSITEVDPIKFDLLFERFVDVQRGGWFITNEVKKQCEQFVSQ